MKVILTLFRNDLLIDWKANQRGWPSHGLITMLLSLLSHSSVGLVGLGFPSGPLSWSVTTHRCHHHHHHPRPLLVSTFLSSVKLLEIICVGVWFVCVSSNGLSMTAPVGEPTQTNPSNTWSQNKHCLGASRRDEGLEVFFSLYIYACVCGGRQVCTCQLSSLSVAEGFEGGPCQRGGGREVLIPGLLKAQPRPFCSGTWENTCHGH